MVKLRVGGEKPTNEIQDNYLRYVDYWAEEYRKAYMTPGSGQSMTYNAKTKEAEDFPNGSQVFLAEEARSLGIPVEDVVHEVLESKRLWQEYGAKIEGGRLAAKKAIRATDSPEEMYKKAQDFVVKYKPLK